MIFHYAVSYSLPFAVLSDFNQSKYEHKGKVHFVCGFEVAMVQISSATARAQNSQRIPGLLYTCAPIRELFTENVQYPGAMVTTKLKVEKCTLAEEPSQEITWDFKKFLYYFLLFKHLFCNVAMLLFYKYIF